MLEDEVAVGPNVCHEHQIAEHADNKWISLTIETAKVGVKVLLPTRVAPEHAGLVRERSGTTTQIYQRLTRRHQ